MGDDGLRLAITPPAPQRPSDVIFIGRVWVMRKPENPPADLEPLSLMLIMAVHPIGKTRLNRLLGGEIALLKRGNIK